MDLSTRYLGFDLPHPFMPGASPLVDELDTVKELEDAGASAIVMHSLFEEQITREQVATFMHTESHAQSFAEQGQLVRLASEISNSRMGACLDLSLLFASCLELMGLNTVIALTRTHAFVGVWLIDNTFPLLTNDD